MLSFYTRGMSFVDIAYLKKADLKSGVLTYRRQKTGRRLSKMCISDSLNEDWRHPVYRWKSRQI